MTNTRIPKLFVLLLIVAVAAAQAGEQISRAGQALAPDDHQPEYVAGEVIVQFSTSAQSAQNHQALAALGAENSRRLGRHGYHSVQLKPGQSVAEALKAYGADPAVAYVQPNYIYHAQAIPNDTDFGELWGLQNSNQTISDPGYPNHNPPGITGSDLSAVAAWDLITDCSDVTVAVLDTGINYTHQDLVANMWTDGEGHHGHDFVDGDSDPMPTGGAEQHGTHVAGIIGAVGNNARGTTGVCWRASIMSVRVLDDQGFGTTADIIQGVEWAADNGADVINMSLGGINPFDPAYSSAIDSALDQDVLVVVAAGNDNLQLESAGTEVYPCSFTQDNLLCVAALDQAYELADFSNYGEQVVDLGAPGANIRSSWGGDIIVDPMDGSGWGQSTGGDWTVEKNCTVSGISLFVNPSSWCAFGQYATNADEQFWKTFSFSSLASTLEFEAAVNIVDGQHFFRVGAVASDENPFDLLTGGVELKELTGLNDFANYSLDLNQASCGGGDCTIGFQLQTDATAPNPSAGEDGVGIARIRISTIQQNSDAYKVENGTSMASPYVAGVAALVRAFSPNFTAEDTYNALIQGGRDVPALVATTTSGRSVDALGALSWIDPPSAPTVQVVP